MKSETFSLCSFKSYFLTISKLRIYVNNPSDNKVKFAEAGKKIEELNEKIEAYKEQEKANAVAKDEGTLFGIFSAALLGSLLFPLAPLVIAISIVALPIILFLGVFPGIVSGVEKLDQDEIFQAQKELVEFCGKNGISCHFYDDNVKRF